ncbi:MAG: hypothetical protein ACRCX1_06425, partial [Bacteroidales bacterium]
GFVRNPEYYFDEKNTDRHQALDLLLMVQGWNRYYPWKMMTDITLDSIRYMPEIGIETTGKVVSMVKQIPKPNVDVSFLLHVENDSTKQNHMYTSKTDEIGRFSLTIDSYGKMPFILGVMEKGKRKDYRILLDRLFSPEPQAYNLTDLQYEIKQLSEEKSELIIKDKPFDENLDSLFLAFEDSLKRVGIDEKVHRLKEVKVKGKKANRESDIFRNKATSVAYYDMASEVDKLIDQGEYVGNSLVEVLKNINPKFISFPAPMHLPEVKKDRKNDEGSGFEVYVPSEIVKYKSREVLFVINFEAINDEILRSEYYKTLNINAIKSIYVNETTSAKVRYCGDPLASVLETDAKYGCVVFIDLYPENQIPARAGKGTRKTWIEGYQHPSAFYHPDYSTLPLTEDYRRTLYWNPMLTTDETGKANIRFYNNSRCKQIEVHAEAVMQDGRVGSYKE